VPCCQKHTLLLDCYFCDFAHWDACFFMSDDEVWENEQLISVSTHKEYVWIKAALCYDFMNVKLLVLHNTMFTGHWITSYQLYKVAYFYFLEALESVMVSFPPKKKMCTMENGEPKPQSRWEGNLPWPVSNTEGLSTGYDKKSRLK